MNEFYIQIVWVKQSKNTHWEKINCRNTENVCEDMPDVTDNICDDNSDVDAEHDIDDELWRPDVIFLPDLTQLRHRHIRKIFYIWKTNNLTGDQDMECEEQDVWPCHLVSSLMSNMSQGSQQFLPRRSNTESLWKKKTISQ